jgi:hypothetical protein
MGFGMTSGHVIRNSKAALVDPSQGYDIVLLSGQSNMCGRGAVVVGTDIYDTAVDQYDGNSISTLYRTIRTGADPLQQPELSIPLSTGVGPGVSFGRAYAAATGRKVLLVPSAWGGTGLVGGSTITWSPYGSNNRDFLNAIDQANRAISAAIAKYPNSQYVGNLWLQGEADGSVNITKAAYQSALIDMLAAFRSQIMGASGSWTIIGQMMPEAIVTQGSTYAQIDRAHKEVAATQIRMAFASIGTGYNSGDNLHYNAAGARLIGTTMQGRVADAKLRTESALPGAVINLATTGASQSAIPLSWDFPSTGGITTSFYGEYKATASGTWLPMVMNGLATSLSVSGLTPSTSYDFRIRSVNSNGNGTFATLTTSTAAADVLSNVRLGTLTGIIETGDGTAGWNYGASTGATFAANHAGVSSLKLPAGVNGGIRWTLNSTYNSGRAWMLGVVTSQTDPAYNTGASGYLYAVYNGGTQYSLKKDGSATTVNPTTVVTPETGDIMQLRRVGGVWVAEVAKAATPNAFTTIYTFAVTNNADVWFAVSANSTTGTSIMNGPLVGINVA